ncbi:MAG: ABC transporter ATP-binding protein [Planctomycetota bacterium]|nr:ABC transporter ATP-binding protein [Planctomycetota bacterium]
MTHLVVDQLKFGYTERMIIDGVSLDLRAGEVLVLLGANGAGKTTLLRLIARQLKLKSGTMHLDESDVTKLSRRNLAQQIALMPQHENQTSTLTVHDVVSLGRMPHCGWWAPLSNTDHSRVEEAINVTGLSSFRNRSILELSGGEWRRMILARAIAQDASVLLLDEPIAGLDLKYQYEVLDQVRKLTKQNRLVSVVTLHDMNMAAMFADRVAILHGGKLLAIGKAEEVITSDVIRQAFDVEVSVMKHPTLGTPLVVPLHDFSKTRSM